MAMKKKFLALAMTAMVAFPVGVHAAGNASNGATYNLIESANPQDQSLITEIPVNGEVLNSNNKSGKIQVEIPTAMAFTVDKDSQITGPTYQVKNLGANDIELYVSAFAENSGNMKIHTEQEIQDDILLGVSSLFARNHVSLKLTGNAGNSVDLGEVAQGNVLESQKKVADVGANGGIQNITLSGIAGKKSDASIDQTGTAGDFKLSFKIVKN